MSRVTVGVTRYRKLTPKWPWVPRLSQNLQPWPSPIIVKSQYEWKILEWDNKPQINKQEKTLKCPTKPLPPISPQSPNKPVFSPQPPSPLLWSISQPPIPLISTLLSSVHDSSFLLSSILQSPQPPPLISPLLSSVSHPLWTKNMYPRLGTNALYDVYCICKQTKWFKLKWHCLPRAEWFYTWFCFLSVVSCRVWEYSARLKTYVIMHWSIVIFLYIQHFGIGNIMAAANQKFGHRGNTQIHLELLVSHLLCSLIYMYYVNFKHMTYYTLTKSKNFDQNKT